MAVLIKTNEKYFGTGAYFENTDKKEIYLISANHVYERILEEFADLEKKTGNTNKIVTLESFVYGEGKAKKTKILINLNKLGEENIKMDSKHDVIAIRIYKNEISVNGVENPTNGQFYRYNKKIISRYADLGVGSDIFVHGYPSIGTPNDLEFDNEKPLIRKGIISAFNDKNQTIIIDCPVNFGNSGGPVIQAEIDYSIAGGEVHYRVIGIVVRIIPFMKEKTQNLYTGEPRITDIENTGLSVVVPMDRVLELVDTFY